MNQGEINLFKLLLDKLWFLNELTERGELFVKRVGHGSRSSGVIYVPKVYQGRYVKVAIIPIENDERYTNPLKEKTKIINKQTKKEFGNPYTDRVKIETDVKEDEN